MHFFRPFRTNAVTSLWIIATLIAAAAQTARNAMQRNLTAMIGTVGATQVRFLFGFPFSLLFLAGVSLATGERVPSVEGAHLAFIAGGAVAQIAGTALMLSAMKERSFALTTAYIKTEPVQTALFGVLLLGETLSTLGTVAVIVATSGVLLTAWKPGTKVEGVGLRAAVFGIAAGGFFALAAVSFRGAITSLPDASFVLRATTVLAWSLGVQSLMLLAWMGLFDRPALTKSLAAWKGSIFAGFMGAFASQFWFIGFALTSAANVRTLALVEVIMAQAVARKLFAQSTTRRDYVGMALIVGGVGLLLVAH